MDTFVLELTAAEAALYGKSLILLEGAISEFLSCLDMLRRYQVSLGQHDPVAHWQARIKRADSMRAKLQRLGLEPTEENALCAVSDAAGVRVVCPFVDDVDLVADLLRTVPGVVIRAEKDYIRHPKPNGYRSYHMILSMPLRFTGGRGQDSACLEVQLRTIAMDCWANIEHQLKYKREIPNQALIVSELKRCADEIASTDLSLQALRELISGIPGKEV